MQHPPEIVLTVTNDLSYDQRMQRIGSSLAAAGYKVTLVGRELPNSIPLEEKTFRQVRLKCHNHSGKLFYLEYNWRLYRFLLRYTSGRSAHQLAICAIDLDTIMPVLAISKKRKLPRVYDAHELFTELIEVKRRRAIASVWSRVERTAVPQFPYGYTVNHFIAGEFKRRYGVDYEVVRNMPLKKPPGSPVGISGLALPAGKFFLYQGAVNEGRSFETLIPAMKAVHAPLVIAGAGNFFEQAKAITKACGLENKVIFTGLLQPGILKALTPHAYAGITIFENHGMNQYYSLANRYFDYIQAGIPQLCVDYPEYAALNSQHETALLIHDLSSTVIANALNKLLHDDVLYTILQRNTLIAANEFCWEKEQHTLLSVWNKVLPLK